MIQKNTNFRHETDIAVHQMLPDEEIHLHLQIVLDKIVQIGLESHLLLAAVAQSDLDYCERDFNRNFRSFLKF